MGDSRLEGFDPRTIDKVERLLDLLEGFGEHPVLAGKMAMHGGTAINLREDDHIVVRKSRYKTILAHVGEKSFFDIAFEKLGERI